MNMTDKKAFKLTGKTWKARSYIKIRNTVKSFYYPQSTQGNLYFEITSNICKYCQIVV